MKCKIKNFRDEGDNKYVGFMVERDDGEKFAIDRRVPLSEGKTDEDYTSDAYKALGENCISSKDEIDDFVDNYVAPSPLGEQPEFDAHLGKEWDVNSKSFK